jgi:hypothetical protein
MLALLVAVLGYLFATSFKPGWTLFLNDGPLGALKADYNATPGAFRGVWLDLNWLGANGGSFPIDVTFGQLYALGAIGFSKFHAPVALLILGLSVWFACSVLFRFSQPVSILTALAATLNMNFLSNACWGLSSRPLCLATSFLAIGALSVRGVTRPWLLWILAGLATGLGVTEGADIGVIFSLTIAAYGLFYTVVSEGASVPTLVKGGIKVGVVAVFAGFMAFHIIDTLVFRAKVLDAVASQKEMMSPEQQWDWATQWSLPKAETFRIVVPGLHGYRMDTPGGGRYWGAAGRDPHWEQTHQGFPRFSGAGEYAGVTVVLVALFACGQALRKSGGPFSGVERRVIAFWAVVGFVALLFSWGRFAPFYRLVYALPYFSSIRNPIKWTHTVHLALLMLFAHGLQGLWRGWLAPSLPRLSFGQWWAKASTADRRTVTGGAVILAVSVLGWMVYSTSTGDLVNHLGREAIANQGEDPEGVAKQVAAFSQREVSLYLVFLGLSLTLLAKILTGAFSGSRARLAATLLGLLIVVDLGRANTPWIQHYDYDSKYSSNALLDFLRSHNGHERVTVAPFAMKELGTLQQVYHVEWMQQQFQYYNIPSIDVIQDPRPLPENIVFKEQFKTNVVRLWELTSTRHVLGLVEPFPKMLGEQLDGGRQRFKAVLPFTLYNAGEQRIGVQTNEAGPYAVMEFSGALPRAGLYTQWEVVTNDEAALRRLADPAFNPGTTVLVSSGVSGTPTAGAAPGRVEFSSYSPKHVVLKSQSDAPGILMMTDKHDPDWRVTVDGQPASLLRCNYLMRGVQVAAGTHTIEFRFEPASRGLAVGLAATGLAILLCAVAPFAVRRLPGQPQ